jgi:hypothetical protein
LLMMTAASGTGTGTRTGTRTCSSVVRTYHPRHHQYRYGTRSNR